jgi:hypothetical protein
MRAQISRNMFQARIRATFSDHRTIRAALGDAIPEFPDSLNNWLARLRLLYGVPFNYLVPHEAMLPPESIRFFYLDLNWVDALLDGAFSIGRDLSADEKSAELNLDRALLPDIRPGVRATAGLLRAKGLGQAGVDPLLQVVSGFLLRSRLVTEYPNLGVYAYEKGHTPKDKPNTAFMTILRMERLGDHSDIILCLFDGDAYRVDIHEAPEHLHYGIDSYAYSDGKVTAGKNLRSFTKTDDGQVSISQPPVPVPVDIGGCFRAASPRTLKTKTLKETIQSKLQLTVFDSAEMGFEMTEGVGLVSFNRQPA